MEIFKSQVFQEDLMQSNSMSSTFSSTLLFIKESIGKLILSFLKSTVWLKQEKINHTFEFLISR